MARQVLPWVGAAVGFVVSGGNPMGAQAGFALGSLIGNAVDPIEVQGNKLGDSPTQTAAEGGARAIVFGKGCIRSTCVLERGGRRVIKQRDSSGGKGGSPTTVNERALWTYAIGLGEAIPGGAILRIWEDEKLVYDVTPESTIPADSAAFAQKFRFYDGSEDQLPDPAIEAIYSDPDDAPYYRGTAYVVFPQRDLTDFGERVPTYRFEVATEGIQTISDFMIHSNGEVRFSRDGKNWTEWVDSTIAGNLVSGVADGFVIYGTNTPFVKTRDGSSFVQASGVNSSSSAGVTQSQAALNGETLVIAGSIDAVRYSTDLGASFANGGTPSTAIYSVVPLGSGWLGVQTSRLYTASSPNGAWTLSLDTEVGREMRCAWSDGARALIGGKDSEGVAAWFTSSGTSITKQSIPFDNDSVVTAACKAAGGTRWLIGSNVGEMAYYDEASPDDGWVLSSTTLLYPVTCIAHNGARFVVTCNESAVGDKIRQAWYSDDGDIFTMAWEEAKPLEGITVAAATVMPPVSGGSVPLSYIVSQLHLRSGHTEDDFDVSEMTDNVDGVVIESTVTAAEAINSIIGTHWFDPTEYDGKIRYVRRGKPVVKTLTADDLIDEPETWQRNNAIEYPAKVHFFGQIAESAYAPIKATSSRSSKDIRSHVVGEASISSPETFNDSVRPYEIATIWHKIIWAEAGGEITWRVTDEHMDLVPSDCVGLSWRGQLARARIVQIEDDPGERKLKMKLDRQSAYTANLTEIQVPPAVTPPLTSIPADTALAVLDIPALTDSADSLVYYTAMSGESDNWQGAVLQQSLDEGASFGVIGDSNVNAIMGTLVEPISSAAEWYTDTTNAVIVDLFTEDDLESRSDTEFLRGGGAFALSYETDGNLPRWEILQFRDAEQIGPKRWKLTTLHRGVKSTTPIAHAPGDMFVLLDNAIQRHAAESAWIAPEGVAAGEGQLVHRAVSFGQSPEDADVVESLFLGRSQLEWPVAGIEATRAGGVITATVTPRHRFGTPMNPIQSANFTGFDWFVDSYPEPGDHPLATATTGPDEFTVNLSVPGYGWVSVWCIARNRITGLGGVQPTQFPGEPGFSFVILPPES